MGLEVTTESDIDNILITHNINGAPEFAKSRRILQEIHLYCPSVKTDFAYSLAKKVWQSTVAYLFFFRTDSTDSPDCLPILLSISIFTF